VYHPSQGKEGTEVYYGEKVFLSFDLNKTVQILCVDMDEG